MSQIWIFILGAVVGFVAVFIWVKKSAGNKNNKEKTDPQKNLEQYNQNRANLEAENKQKILNFIRQGANAKATNDSVQKMLNVSDATAERYLNELEKEGKIRQIQEQGRGVYYTK